MKKSKKIGLSLNKKVVSHLNAQMLKGGCPTAGCSGGCSLAGGCGTGNPDPVTVSECCR
ncbi:MAG: class I lanthipeptide [Bacteroidota bacterium]